ncbi:hypothetical protein GYMLUDRAFT_40457 [Collybiopsis luxurians FD-317 M1]|uniref:Uncharacterized protein n=1 Tax=Collybiopsis luxurians FD-317 M1 TaxID=944289 RepID=A0A0D0CWF7_9AGAR|nr:hypothetical protein GYMLUDRAFT_40457 [Collybiopsis luxurians FD-317 M1]
MAPSIITLSLHNETAIQIVSLSKRNSSSAGIAIGLAFGGVAAVVITMGCVWFLLVRKVGTEPCSPGLEDTLASQRQLKPGSVTPYTLRQAWSREFIITQSPKSEWSNQESQASSQDAENVPRISEENSMTNLREVRQRMAEMMMRMEHLEAKINSERDQVSSEITCMHCNMPSAEPPPHYADLHANG